MSGYELESQQVLKDLPELKKSTSMETTEEQNKALLTQLQKSSDIARDLAVLYGDRPYMYARVMQQLCGVLGKLKVHNLRLQAMESISSTRRRTTSLHLQKAKKRLIPKCKASRSVNLSPSL